jgi:hypothetical protein
LTSRSSGKPADLKTLKEVRTDGYKLMGEGFVLSREEYDQTIAFDEASKSVIFPYFGGDDLMELPVLAPSRMAIDFGDMEEEKAKRLATCYNRVKLLVKPFRDSQTGQMHQNCFWKYWDMRPVLRRLVNNETEQIVFPSNSKYLVFRIYRGHAIFNQKCKVIVSGSRSLFGVLQSNVHELWAREFSGSRGIGSIAYSISSALSTFPLPDFADRNDLNDSAIHFIAVRDAIMLDRGIGPTALMNIVHSFDTSSDIVSFRRAIREMENQVMSAYGWSDIDAQNCFDHATSDGETRYCLSREAQSIVLERLVGLNKSIANNLRDLGD